MPNAVAIESAPSRSHWIVVSAIAGILIALAAVAWPIARAQWPVIPAFLPALLGTAIIADLMTASIIYGQTALFPRRSMLVVAPAFIYSAMLTAAYLATFPGLIVPVVQSSDFSVWCYRFWHIGFPVFFIAAAIVDRQSSADAAPLSRRAITTSVIAGIAAAALVLGVIRWLVSRNVNDLISGTDYSAAVTSGVLPAEAALCTLSLIVFFSLMRRNTGVLWLSIALLATTLDVLMTIAGGKRFSAGWYLARVDMLVAATAVLALFLTQLFRQLATSTAQSQAMRELAIHDPLTGLYNRNHLESAFEREFARCQRSGKCLAVAFIDLDHFKLLNDTHGHAAGDAALKLVAQTISSLMVRPADFAARFGGEEFLVVLPETALGGALDVAERIRRAVEALEIPNGAAPGGHVTVSIGVISDVPGDGIGTAHFLHGADMMLYQAKKAGRNRVESVGGAAKLDLPNR